MQVSVAERSMEEPVSQSDSETPTSPDECGNANSLVPAGGVQSVLQRLQEGQARLADVQGELQEMQIRVLTYVEDKLQEHREGWRTELVEEVGKQVTSVLDTTCSSCDRGGQLPAEHGTTKAQLSPSSTCVSLHSSCEVLQSRTWEQRAAAQEKEIESIRSDVARHALRFTVLEKGLRITIDNSVEEFKRIQSSVNAMLAVSDNEAQKPVPVSSHTDSTWTLPQLHAAHPAGVLPPTSEKGLPLSPQLSIDWNRLGDGTHQTRMPGTSRTVGGQASGVLPLPRSPVSTAPGSPAAGPDRYSGGAPRWAAMTPVDRRPLGCAATARIRQPTAGSDEARVTKSSERSSSVPTSPSRVSLVRESRSLVAPVMPNTIPARLAEPCLSARQVVPPHTNNCPSRSGLFEQEEGGQPQPQEAVGRQPGCHPRLAEGIYMLTTQQNSPTGAYRVMTRSTHPMVSPVQMLCHKTLGQRNTHPSTPSIQVRNITGL